MLCLFHLHGEYTAAKSDNAFGKLNIFQKQFSTFFGLRFFWFFGLFWPFSSTKGADADAAVRSLLFMLIACFVRVLLRFFPPIRYLFFGSPKTFGPLFVSFACHLYCVYVTLPPGEGLHFCACRSSVFFCAFSVGLCDTLAFEFHFSLCILAKGIVILVKISLIFFRYLYIQYHSGLKISMI